MISETEIRARGGQNSFSAADVAGILRSRGWLREETHSASDWIEEATALLGPRVPDLKGLAGLLSLVFEYDARAVLSTRESREVLSRSGAREVLRELALEILSGGPVDSNRLKEIVNVVKVRLPYRSREMFLPLRVAVAGRTGDGSLDRVILLLDRAAETPGLAPVKSVRTRILEFCGALD
jgi:hypothetical protein